MSMTYKATMPGITKATVHSTASHLKMRSELTHKLCALPPPAPDPNRMRQLNEPGTSMPMDIHHMEEDRQTRVAQDLEDQAMQAAPDASGPVAMDIAGPSGTTAGAAGQAAPVATESAPSRQTFRMPKLDENYVTCLESQNMLKDVAAQLDVLRDRTPDSEVDTKRLALAHKFIKAAAKWEDTPPTGVDFPGARHAELAISFTSILQHPLITGTSISYSRLKFPVPKEIVYQNIVPHRTDRILEKLTAVAATCGKIPATFQAVPNKDRVNITVTCADGEKMSEIMAKLALESSAYGLHTVKESVMDLSGQRQTRSATWSPVFPLETNALSVSDHPYMRTNRATENTEWPPQSQKQHSIIPWLLHCREMQHSDSPTCLWGKASCSSQWPEQKPAPPSSIKRGRLKPLQDRSWPWQRLQSSAPSSWARTRACVGLIPAEALRWRTGRCCYISQGRTRTRYCITAQRNSKNVSSRDLTKADLTVHPTAQVLQINYLTMTDPRLGRYTACMESCIATKALQECGPIVMYVPDRYSLIAISDQEGPDSHFRHGVDYYIGEEMDPNLIRTAARKAIARALDLKAVELLVHSLDEPDPTISLLGGLLGKDVITIKRSAVRSAELDELVLLDSGLTLAAHIKMKLPNPTKRIVLRGNTKLDAYPLLLAGKMNKKNLTIQYALTPHTQ